MSLEKVYDYFHNYDKQTYQVVACMGNEPSEQDIKDFENQYGINLPADFRTISGNPRQFNYRDESAGVCISAQCK